MLVFMTLAVVLILIVTGLGPHENRMIPPACTAAITAAELQLAAVPCPTTWFACDVSTARPLPGTGTVRAPDGDRCGTDRAVGTTQAPTTRAHEHATKIDARCDTPRRVGPECRRNCSPNASRQIVEPPTDSTRGHFLASRRNARRRHPRTPAFAPALRRHPGRELDLRGVLARVVPARVLVRCSMA